MTRITNRKLNWEKSKYQILFTLLFIFSLSFLSQTAKGQTVYIDPESNNANENGSIDYPYNSLDDFSWSNNTNYLIKRGTTLNYSKIIYVNADNVTFGAYGSGDRPHIFSSVSDHSRVCVVTGDYVTVEDIIFEATDTTAGSVMSPTSCRNTTLRNIKTIGADRGITPGKTVGTMSIIDCEVTYTRDDGMYINTNDTIIIENTHVHHVNTDWLVIPTESYAGGDCIQFNGVNHFEIRNCYLDKTYAGGKFCLIVDNFGSGILENSTLIAGYDSQHVLYTKTGTDFHIRYNKIEGGLVGIWNHSENLQVYHNIVRNQHEAGFRGDGISCSIYNNTFDNCVGGVRVYNETSVLRNNIFYNNSSYGLSNGNNIDSDYNCYYPASQLKSDEANSIGADPLFMDAKTGDFKLSESSPCLNQGNLIAGIAFDIVGTSLPVGSTVDIGAFEYTTAITGGGGSDIGGEDPDTVITPENIPPVVIVDYQKTSYSEIPTVIDASKSYDPNNDNLTYRWTAPENVAISSTTSPTISFLAPTVQSPVAVQFSVSVSDGVNTEVREISLLVAPFKPEIDQVQIISIESSNFQDPNYPENIVDNDSETRWSAQGDGEWLVFELNKSTSISHVKVDIYSGDSREAYFDIQASNDLVEWQPLQSELKSCGFAELTQAFEIPETDVKASSTYKYVRLMGHGNSVNTWNSFTEFKIFGYASTIEENKQISWFQDVENDVVDVYPNPASTEFNINLKKDAQIQILDLNGKTTYEDYGFIGDNIINPNLQAGTYIIRIIVGRNQVVNKKLIVM